MLFFTLDLYDPDAGGIGIGSFDLMANSWGFDSSQYHPPHMSAWSKIMLGWVVPTFPSPGLNRLAASELPNTDIPQVYAVIDGFPRGEFLLIENRQQIGFDSIMPQSGIIIYHIDHSSSYGKFHESLNREGHPGQQGWPENGNHYGVAVAQADGLFELEQFLNKGDEGDFFHGDGVDSLVPCVNLTNCQHPNTDSYQGGVITRTNVHITNISISSVEMTFNYWVSELQSAQPTTTPDIAPTNYPSVAPSIQPTQCLDPGLQCRTHDHCCSGLCMKHRKRFFGSCY
jgi:hypothetical protein